jgi:RNA polymerase sigma-70 factor, ECF subfamily
MLGTDVSAFRGIVEAHKARVYRLALAIVGDQADAEDITQEVFLRVYQSHSTFRGDSAVSTWLYRITTNVCLSSLSRGRDRLSRGESYDDNSEAVPSALHASAIPPDRDAEASLMSDRIQEAQGTLTPRERAVFVMRHFEDLALKDIAFALSVRIGTVKSLLFRAVEKMQTQLSYYREEIGS